MKQKLKIPGITGMPLFITKWRGRLDGRHGVVQFTGGKWSGHYMEKKCAAYHAFLCAIYRSLEEQTAPLHKESAVLAIEYADILKQLSAPEAPIPDCTRSSQARAKAGQATRKFQLQASLLSMSVRLSRINEDLTKAANETEIMQREAQALTVRRVQAYLHGAAITMEKSDQPTEYTVHDGFNIKNDYTDQHKANDEKRKAILSKICGGDGA